MLRNGADPGVNDKRGYCAVHYASAYGRTLCLELVGASTALTGIFSRYKHQYRMKKHTISLVIV